MNQKIKAAQQALAALAREFNGGREVYEAACHFNHGNNCMAAQVIVHSLHIECRGGYNAVLGQRMIVAAVDTAADAEEFALEELRMAGYYFDQKEACEAANDLAYEKTAIDMNRAMMI
mgnify:CR=1 FL=1